MNKEIIAFVVPNWDVESPYYHFDISVNNVTEDDDFEENVEIEQTTEILHSLGFYWPEPDKEYLKRLIDYLNKFNYFE